MRLSKKNSIRKAALWIIFCTLFVSGGATLILVYFFHLRALQRTDPAFQIVAIEHAGLLPTDYLAELLELSVDVPTYLPLFNIQSAKEKLLKSPFIHTVQIKKGQPNRLFVDYDIRRPVVLVADWEKAALDREKVLIPLEPFNEGYEDRKMSEIIIGDVAELSWGKAVEGGGVTLGYALLETLNQEWVRIDISRVEESSLGKREVIVTFLDAAIILRLNPDFWREGLFKYLKLVENKEIGFEFITPEFKKKRMDEGKKLVVDMRLKDLAFYYTI